MSVINPRVTLLENPSGIDKAIQSVQIKLSQLSWLELVFGRATMQKTKEQKKVDDKRFSLGEIIYPQVIDNAQPVSAMPNDNLKAMGFFHTDGEVRFPEYDYTDSFGLDSVQGVSLIIWANLSKINDPAYTAMEHLRKDVLKKLKTVPRVFLKSSTAQYDQVFSPYTITEVYRQYMLPPFCAFRVNFDISFEYLEIC